MKPNTPEAAARLLAATVMADGMASADEMSLLRAQAAQLGLSEAAMCDIVQALCEERQMFSDSAWCAGPCDDQSDALLAAVTDPALRGKVLSLAMALVQADRHVSEGEGQLLARMQREWRTGDWLIAA